jgi:hypothetical protein
MEQVMDTIYEFEHGKLTVRIFSDSQHETRGSYAYDTEQETRAAENEELAKLESGEWIVVGFVAYDGCEACGHLSEFDSCWGIVCENTEDAVQSAVLNLIGEND